MLLDMFVELLYTIDIVVWHFMQLFVMNNAAFMEGFVIMESVNSVVLTMQVTHARTVPCSSLVFQFVKMSWRENCLVSTAHPVNQVYCSS